MMMFYVAVILSVCLCHQVSGIYHFEYFEPEDSESPTWTSAPDDTHTSYWRASADGHERGHVEVIPSPDGFPTSALLHAKFNLADVGHALEVIVTYWMSESSTSSQPQLSLYTDRYNDETDEHETEQVYRFNEFSGEEWRTIIIPLEVDDPINTRVMRIH